MDPQPQPSRRSTDDTIRPSHFEYSTRTLSGYGSAMSSLPGSGAVTPRTPGYMDAEVSERTALLEGRPGRDISEAEAGSRSSIISE